MLRKYYFRLLFSFKSRQGLLGLAIFGLFLSSFALLVLQSTMGGLQSKLIGRSKAVSGTAYIKILNEDEALTTQLVRNIENLGFKISVEYQLELMLKFGSLISPIVLHGIDTNFELPDFLEDKKLDNLSIGRELAYKLNLVSGDEVNLISPSHVNSLMGDIPRFTSLKLKGIVETDVTEIDMYHSWVRLGVVQNLIRRRATNIVRLYGDGNFSKLKSILNKYYGKNTKLITWEEENSTLVYALKLESIVMVFLFIAMTILVSFCITSGLMIFLSKMKYDLTSLWILGASEKKLFKSCSQLINILGLLSVSFGILSGLLFLYLLDHYGVEVMPAVFVDRKIPIKVTVPGLLISFFIPYCISIIFSWYSLLQFKRDTHYLEHVKSFS